MNGQMTKYKESLSKTPKPIPAVGVLFTKKLVFYNIVCYINKRKAFAI